MASPRRWTPPAIHLATPGSWRRSAKVGANQFTRALLISWGRLRAGMDPRDLKTTSPSWRSRSFRHLTVLPTLLLGLSVKMVAQKDDCIARYPHRPCAALDLWYD